MTTSLTATRTLHSKPGGGRAKLCPAPEMGTDDGLTSPSIGHAYPSQPAPFDPWKRLPAPISA